MTKKNNRKSDLKESTRQTPYDVRVEGTLASARTPKVKTVRKATPAETKANNEASVRFAKAAAELRHLLPLFDAELEEMNRGKRGRPFEFCDSMIFWILTLMTLNGSTFREAAGYAEGRFAEHSRASPSYSRLFERVRDMLTKAMEASDGILASGSITDGSGRVRRLGIDSSGFSLSDSPLWREVKWGTGNDHKGWLKLHALSDVDSGEIVAYAITTDKVGDAPLLEVLLAKAVGSGCKVSELYADGAYSSVRNFQFVCGKLHTKFVTSFKKNTRPANNGSVDRGEATRLWCSLPYEEWVVVSGYGTRWKCECTFSDIKRMFGEECVAKTVDGAVRRLMCKVIVHNGYKALRYGILTENAQACA